MVIKKGYKMTDVGVIPEDWEVKSIGELFSSLRSASITKEMFVEKGCMCVHYGDIHTKYGRILDCDKDVIPNVPISLCKNYPNVEDGDIIMADASEDLEGVGKCVSVINTRGRDIISGLHTILLRDRNNSFYNSFPTYMFSCENVKKGIESYAVGTKVNSISYNSIKDCQFCYPSKKEQQAIADALTMVDNLIMSLSKVIEKKKLIKKGTMQKLLSGEVRLNGFEGEWNFISFKNIYTYASEGGTPDTKNEKYYKSGVIPFVKIEDTISKYIKCASSFITELGLEQSSAWILPAGNLILTNGATIGNVSINLIPITTKQGILGIIVNSDYHTEFLYYLFKNETFQTELQSKMAIGTFATITLNNLNDIQLLIPPTKAEQTAIADILTTMDNEIEALEKERDKYKCIKQGMMQQLLTGKIRLICQ